MWRNPLKIVRKNFKRILWCFSLVSFLVNFRVFVTPSTISFISAQERIVSHQIQVFLIRWWFRWNEESFPLWWTKKKLYWFDDNENLWRDRKVRWSQENDWTWNNLRVFLLKSSSVSTFFQAKISRSRWEYLNHNLKWEFFLTKRLKR